MSANSRVCVGAIAGSFGVRGEARIKSFCADPAAIADYGPLFTADGARSFSISLSRPVKGGYAARLGGVQTKEQADALKGTKLFADRTALPNLPEDEYYYSDLIGLDAFDTGGKKVGKVTAVHDHGGGDILEIAKQGGKTELILFTADTVPMVDIAAKRVIIDWPEDANDK